jgi:CRP/FNR family transcriptional regulator, cyclic AMP receptor protein
VLSGIDELRQFKIFAELDEEDFESIGRISHVRQFDTAEKLTTEGAPADQLYLFLKGKAAVRVRSSEGQQVLVDELGPGELLGWGAVMEPHVYTASAWTSKPSEVIVIDGKRLRELCDANKRIGYHVARGIGEVMSRRFGQAVGGRGGPAVGGHGIDELRQFKIFAELDVADLDAIAQIAHVEEFESGEELTTEGAAAERLYLFLKGKAAVKVRSPGGQQVLIDELGPGELLGWGAVMEPHVCTASAWTTERSEVVVVPGADLRELCDANKHIGYQVAKGIGEVMSRRFGQAVGGRGGQAAEERGIDQLRRFQIFAELDDADLGQVARIAHVQEFETAEELTTEGAAADRLYLFLKGRAAVKVRSTDGRQILIDELGPGEMLGWGAVTEPHVYTASTWTTEPSEVIVVGGADLRELCDINKHIGYQVAKGVGEVISRRFGRVLAGRGGQAIAGHGIDELRQFKIFAELDVTDLDSITRIAHVRELESGEEVITEGAPAEQLYLFLQGKAVVKVRAPEGHQVLIDEVGPGEMLGWGAVMEPHVYAASAWTTERSELIVIPGKDLRELCEANKHMGYQVVKGIGEVMSKRFGHTIGGHGIAELHQFKILEELDVADLDSIARIAHVQEFEAGEELTTEGAAADQLYLFLKGKAAVKVRSPEGRQVLIDELGPGEVLGWSAVMEPYIYSASAWTTEPCELIVVPGDRLRELCETNRRMGYQVVKGVGEVIARRFGQAIGGRGDLREKDLRAFGGEERVIWDNGELQLTTEAVLIGMDSDSPDVIPLEAILDLEIEGDCVVFHVHGGDACSPPLDDPKHLAALVHDEMLRTRYAHRRRGYYLPAQ